MSTNNWLEGRHALVTGGGTGIGASAATHLHAAGAKLSLLGRRLEPLERTAGIVAGTVAQNIARFMQDGADTIVEAAMAAGAHEMILQLPQGY